MQVPRILWENILNVTTASFSASTEAIGYFGQYINDWRTHTYWKGTTSSSVEFSVDLGSGGDRAADCIGICTHNLYTANYKYSVQHSTNGTTWTTCLSDTPATSDDILISTFAEATKQYWKVTLTSSAITTSVPYISVMALGTALSFPKPPLIGTSPVNAGIEMKSNRSQTGILLGNVISYHPISLALSFNYLPATFFRTTSGAPAGYGTFWKNHGRYMLPFFVQFSGDTFPEANYLMRLTEGSQFTMPLHDSTMVQSLSMNLISCQESST